MRENLKPFNSETAKHAAKLSARARFKGVLVRKSFLITQEQAIELAKIGNSSQLIRDLLAQRLQKH